MDHISRHVSIHFDEKIMHQNISSAAQCHSEIILDINGNNSQHILVLNIDSCGAPPFWGWSVKYVSIFLNPSFIVNNLLTLGVIIGTWSLSRSTLLLTFSFNL